MLHCGVFEEGIMQTTEKPNLLKFPRLALLRKIWRKIKKLFRKEKTYAEHREQANYSRRVIELLKEIASDSDCDSVIDVGSKGVDVISGLPLKNKVSIDLTCPLVAECVEGITGDFFDFQPKEQFDIVCCMQVLEHIPEVEKFAEKLFEIARRYVVLSVPYKWECGYCHWHIHDPVDEEKLAAWTKEQPILTEYIRDGNDVRMLCVYKKTS